MKEEQKLYQVTLEDLKAIRQQLTHALNELQDDKPDIILLHDWISDPLRRVEKIIMPDKSFLKDSFKNIINSYTEGNYLFSDTEKEKMVDELLILIEKL